MYIDDIRKHDRPDPKKTANDMSRWVADSLTSVILFQKLGAVVVTSSLIKDLKEYCELNIFCFLIYA